MSALGQKQTSEKVRVMSALPQKADTPLTHIGDLGIVILQNKNPGDQAESFGPWALPDQSTFAPHQNSINQDLENLSRDFAWGVSAPLTLTKINYVGWAGQEPP